MIKMVWSHKKEGRRENTEVVVGAGNAGNKTKRTAETQLKVRHDGEYQ